MHDLFRTARKLNVVFVCCLSISIAEKLLRVFNSLIVLFFSMKSVLKHLLTAIKKVRFLKATRLKIEASYQQRLSTEDI